MLSTLKRTTALPKSAVAVAAVSMVLVSLVGTTQAQSAPVTPDREIPSGWNWTNYGPELKSISCSAPNVCAAVGQGGAVLRSPGTDDVRLAWTMVKLVPNPDPKMADDPIDLVGVSCSATSCLAVSSPKTPSISYGSWVYRSTDAGVTWASVQQLPPVGTRKTMIGSAIGCAPDPAATASNRVCIIAGTAGGLWRSTDDGQTWTGLPLPTTALPITSFNKVACLNPSACVVAGGANSPSSAFINGTTVTVLDTPPGIDKSFAALACDGTSLCIGTGGQGGYTVMTVDAKPTWGTVRPTFRKSPLPPVASVVSVTCPAAGVCVGIDGSGLVLRTSTLGDPTSYWNMHPVPMIIGTVFCIPNTGNCYGVGKKAAYYESFDAGSTYLRVNEIAGFDVALCGGTLGGACIAGGKENVGRSITGGTLWNLPIADRGALNTQALRCQSSLSCQIFGMTEVLTTTDMDVFRSRYGPTQSTAGSDATACVTDDLCVSPSKAGTVYTTFDGGRTMWSSNQMPLLRPTTIACLDAKTSPVTCLVPNKYNILLGTMRQDPDGVPHWNWKYTNADSDQILTAIDCTPDGSRCVAAGEQGQILTTLPNDLMNWTPQVLPIRPTVAELPSYSSVSCPANGFCMVGGKHGPQSVVTSTLDFFNTYSYDEIGDIRDAPGITSFGCESINRCVGVGMTVLLGLRNPPVAPPAK